MVKQLFILISFLIISSPAFSQSEDSLFTEPLKNPKRYKLAGLQIEGANFSDKNVISLLSGLTVGEEITIPGDKATDAIRKLWKQNLFEDVQIIQDKIIGNDLFLIVKVTERPRLTKFKFKGDVRKSDADDIRGKIRLLTERVVTDYMVGTIKNTVRDYYLEKGFYFTKVDITQVKDTTQKTPHTILTINVKKGRKVRISRVNIKGNTVIRSWKIRGQLEDTKARKWYNPFNSGKYLEENLHKDLPAIAEKYNSKGYRDARVVKDSVYFVSDNRVAIDITIDEGHKYYFGNFKWYGNSKYRSGQLDTILNIHPGDVYDQSKLEQKLFMNPTGYDISSLYLDDGYLFFQVNQQESNIHNDTIDFDVLMYEGKQATINKVTVKGNDKTNDHVIYRQIFTRPGQLFRRTDIIRSVRELSQLGYFDPEKITPVPIPNAADGTVDIEYSVEEKPSDQIELSGGWGGATAASTGGLGIIGTLGVTFNNFSTKNIFKKEAWRPLPSGDGQRLSVRAQTNGLYYQSYNFSFTEPWLGGKKPNSLTVSAFHSVFNQTGAKKYVNDANGNKIFNPARQSMSIYGGSVGLGRRLKWPDNYFNMYTSVSYNYYDLHNYGTTFVFPTGYANDLSFGLNISRNSIDQTIYPKSGSNFVMSGQWTPPYSLVNGKDYSKLSDEQYYKFVEYQKYKITAEWFTQLTNKKAGEGKEARNLVLRTKVGYGFLARYNNKLSFSPFERFYMGGSGLSGFQNFVAREIVGLRGYPDPSSSFSGDPIAARYTMELRYPVSLNPQATIFVLGFAEAGNTWANFKTFNPFQVKRSAGFGLRVFLPMFGLLGVDYGWGFDAPLNSSQSGGYGKGQFHFTIGGTLGEL